MRPDLRISALLGALMGLWWASLLWILDRWARGGWPSFPPEDVPPIGLSDALGLATPLWITTVGFLVGFPALFAGWAALERWTGMDPRQRAWDAICWTSRRLAWPMVALAVAVVAVFVASVLTESLWLVVALFLFVLPAGVAPFSVLRKDVVSSPSGGKWWRPRWPGIGPVATAICVGVSVELVAWSVARPGGTAFELSGWLVRNLLGLFATPVAAAILIFRLGPKDAWETVRDAARWSVVGPILALEARILSIVLAVLAPIVFVRLALSQLIPLHAQVYAAGESDSEMPGPLRLAVAFFRFLGDHSLWLFVGATVVAILMVVGRLVWLLIGPKAEGVAA